MVLVEEPAAEEISAPVDGLEFVAGTQTQNAHCVAGVSLRQRQCGLYLGCVEAYHASAMPPASACSLAWSMASPLAFLTLWSSLKMKTKAMKTTRA